MKHSASSRLAGCDKNSETFSASSVLNLPSSLRGWQGVTRIPRLRAALLFREEQLPRDTFSRQAAKVAKEKREYFCSDFPRLFTTSARYRSLNAEVCSSCTFRCFCRAAPCNRHGSCVGVVTVPRLTALPYHLPLMTLSFRWH